jgi:hypothetical protein
MPGTTSTSGGAGKIIGGGRGKLTCTLTPAIAETGIKTIKIKNTFKINLFIGLPPLFVLIKHGLITTEI